jgi:hypothetical protein
MLLVFFISYYVKFAYLKKLGALMEQIASWEAHSRSYCSEIARLLRNLKANYIVHKKLDTVH